MGNSCGIHIHAGTTCAADALGYYYTGTVTSDPWTSVAYTSTGSTTAGVVHVTTGGLGSDVQGRAMIIHAFDGSRIACALIKPLVATVPSIATGFVPYYTYTGNMAVSGTVGPMTTDGVTQSFAYSLEGVDPLCENGAGTEGNSCGIHIHAGTTCAGNALGHYYTGAVTSDPWTSVAYTSMGSTTAGVVHVTTGGIGSDVQGRAMIIHAFDGSRIACALLQPMQPAPEYNRLRATGFVPYYTYTGNMAVSGTVGPMIERERSQCVMSTVVLCRCPK